LLLAPQVIGFILVGVVALVRVAWLSLFRVDVLAQRQTFVGLRNYSRILSDAQMATILPNTLFLVAFLSTLGTLAALLLAILLNQRLPGMNVFRAAVFTPTLVTMVAWTLVWQFILQPHGLLDSLTAGVGIPPQPWLRSRWLTLFVLVIVQLLKNVGINVMIFLAALQAVPQDLIDATKVDGSGKWGTFRHAVLPQVSPSILMVFMLMITGSFKVFELVLLLTDGGPGVETEVLSIAIYKQAFQFDDIGYSSALSVLLFAIVLLLTLVVWQVRRRVVFHESD